MKKVPVPAHDPDWLALDMPTRDRIYCWLAALSDLPSGLPVCGTGGIIDRLAKAMGCSKGLAKKDIMPGGKTPATGAPGERQHA